MIIGVDFDNVLFPTTQVALDLYNKQYHDTLALKDITTYSFYECLDSSVADKIIELFIKKKTYDNLKPIKGAVETLRKLTNQGHEIFILTATDTRNLVFKEELLKKFFPFIPTENLIRIYKKQLFYVDVMIEDNLDQLKESICDRVLLDYPYNQDTSADYAFDIRRCSTWAQIMNVIDKINKKESDEG